MYGRAGQSNPLRGRRPAHSMLSTDAMALPAPALEPVSSDFWLREPAQLAGHLLGRWMVRRVQRQWAIVQIVECEAYYLRERASHSSLGRTPSREAMFMAPGTIYMYHSRGGDSLNLSAAGDGNAVLVKAACLPEQSLTGLSPAAFAAMVERMASRNPLPGDRPRPLGRLAAGQCLMCRCLDVRRVQWNGRPFDGTTFWLAYGSPATEAWQCRRLGIATGRDEHLYLRFVDVRTAHAATQDPRKGPLKHENRLVTLRRGVWGDAQGRRAEAIAGIASGD